MKYYLYEKRTGKIISEREITMNEAIHIAESNFAFGCYADATDPNELIIDTGDDYVISITGSRISRMI